MVDDLRPMENLGYWSSRKKYQCKWKHRDLIFCQRTEISYACHPWRLDFQKMLTCFGR